MPVRVAHADADITVRALESRLVSGRSSSAHEHVVTVAFPFEGSVIGGSHISALRLIQNLDRASFRPLVLLHHGDSPVGDLFRAEGLEPAVLPSAPPFRPRARPAIADLFRLPGHFRRMAAFLSAHHVGIVHTNEGAMHANWTLPAALCGIPHVWHHRGSPDALGLKLIAPLLASRVIAVSRFATSASGLLHARGTARVIYSPFDQSICETDRHAARTRILNELRLSPDTGIVSYLGHFAERKRPDMFVRTLTEFRQLHPGKPVIGLIFGHEEKPGQSDRLRQVISACDAGGIIRLMGFRRPIEGWLAGSDTLLVPAVEEPFGRTLIEAMLIGTPVVAAASGGNIEAIEHGRTGLLATPDQPAALAAALATVLLNPELARHLADAAKRDALRKFDTETHVRGVEAVYREVLGR